MRTLLLLEVMFVNNFQMLVGHSYNFERGAARSGRIAPSTPAKPQSLDYLSDTAPPGNDDSATRTQHQLQLPADAPGHCFCAVRSYLISTYATL
jgi:hypothetical protein